MKKKEHLVKYLKDIQSVLLPMSYVASQFAATQVCEAPYCGTSP
jgi:hypothetical protein